MNRIRQVRRAILAGVIGGVACTAQATTFGVQCPTHTALHPLVNAQGISGQPDSTLPNPHIKCQQLSGGDGYATMGDGTQTYLFAFGPLSGLQNIYRGKEGTVPNIEFNRSNLNPDGSVIPEITQAGTNAETAWRKSPFNGAVGLVPDVVSENTESQYAATPILHVNMVTELANSAVVTVSTVEVNTLATGDTVRISDVSTDFDGIHVVTVIDSQHFSYTVPTANGGTDIKLAAAAPQTSIGSAWGIAALDGHVDPRLIMDVGVLNGNMPAPLIVIDEGDELFLTLTNVGMVMRPDLFEQHTVHFHGYPNASAFYDGVPDASVAINVGGSFTYYYLAPEPGTYMWHCHISPPEHLQMGMVGQLYVRPQQNTVVATKTDTLASALQIENKKSLFGDALSATNAGVNCSDVLCVAQTPLPAGARLATPPIHALKAGRQYAYNDGDGSTGFDVQYPMQMMGFDPNFHFVGMTFNPESFANNKDKYFLLNGRSYPDTVGGYQCGQGKDEASDGKEHLPACANVSDGTVVAGPMRTLSSDGKARYSQALPSVINVPAGGKALLRFADLNVTEYHTLASLGMRMHVVGMNARLLRDLDGNNTDYYTNSITLAGGESVDVMLEACNIDLDPATGECPAGQSMASGTKFYLYTPQLDHLSNDAENFGGMMTEVNVCDTVDPDTRQCKCASYKPNKNECVAPQASTQISQNP